MRKGRTLTFAEGAGEDDDEERGVGGELMLLSPPSILVVVLETRANVSTVMAEAQETASLAMLAAGSITPSVGSVKHRRSESPTGASGCSKGLRT